MLAVFYSYAALKNVRNSLNFVEFDTYDLPSDD